LSAHLYSGPEVYLRELLQNGVDALTARASLLGRGAPSWGVRARAVIEDGVRILEVSDDGVGLLPDEMERFLSTIGESSKRGGVAELESARAELLGQFGIGLLSCFMIADEVVVTSRSARSPSPGDAAPVVRWRGRSDGTYEVASVTEAHPVGTTVRLVPKRGMEEWVEPERVRELIARFGALLPWPLHVDDGLRALLINPEPPPWALDLAPVEKARALLRFGEGVLGERPLDVIPLKSEHGLVEGAAFVHARARPLQARRSDRVYLKGMLLAENASDLLPEWAFFVTAVVNARGLRPTASREALYVDDNLDEAREELGAQIKAWLVRLAREAPVRLDQLVQIHHLAMKQLAAHDDEFLEIILDALPFETTLGHVAFGEIARRAGTELRFTTSRDAFRSMAPIARSEGIVLVNAAYVFESEILARAMQQRTGTRFVKVEAADLARNLVDGGGHTDALREIAEEALDDAAVTVSVKQFAPAALPSFLATGDDVNTRRAIDQSKAVSGAGAWSGLLDDLGDDVKDARAELVLNASNAIVQKLAELARESSPLVSTAVRVLYVQALLLGHHPLGPKELAIMNNGIVELLEWGLASTQGVS
ncbi:MAG TPA: HSP90 family protein, partial [Myxococcota bacterium]